MTLKLKLGRDADGRPRAEAEDRSPRGRLVARFLEIDVVDDGHARALVEAARRAARPSYRSSGNAYELAIGPRRTTITAQVEPRTGPASVALPTPEFRALMTRWLALLQDDATPHRP